MVNKPKALGTAAETAVVRALRTLGWPHAERRALAGAADLGDITGTPGVAWEVKGGQQTRSPSDEQVVAWMAETEVERIHSGADVGVLVLRRHGIGESRAHRWWAYLPAIWVTRPMVGDVRLSAGPLDHLPVRLLLGDACLLLRTAGYGQPLPETTP